MKDKERLHMGNILEMNHITKAFPGVLALNDVSFQLRKGEFHAICGENGAGKSTLMKVLGGVYIPDSGEILINDKPVRIATPQDSIRNKISIIYQEFNLVPELNIIENLFLGKEIKKGLGLNMREMENQAKQTMARLGLDDFDCTRLISSCSIATQQLVEIGKAIFNDADILVMDEPTAVLSEKETAALFYLIEQLLAKGISIIYISHRLEEIVSRCHRISVLRDGKNVETLDNTNRDIKKDDIIKLMVGRDLTDYYPEKVRIENQDTILEVKNISKAKLFDDVSFKLAKGEILGFSGLVGAGRSEIMQGIFGAHKIDSGDVIVNGNKVNIKSPSDAIRAGIALLPEDRKREGLVLKLNLGDNICLATLKEVSEMGTIIKKRKNSVVNKFIKDLQIRPALPERLVENFSGGNQQKAVIAKWLNAKPKIVILDEPTRGIDVGAKSEIYSIINNLAEQGVGVIFISSELLELIGVCDRILVIRAGKIAAEYMKEDFSEEEIIKSASYN
jgi:ribose transport system ATP-binding protein